MLEIMDWMLGVEVLGLFCFMFGDVVLFFSLFVDMIFMLSCVLSQCYNIEVKVGGLDFSF